MGRMASVVFNERYVFEVGAASRCKTNLFSISMNNISHNMMQADIV